MKVTAICATAGRHTLLERSVGLFLQQVQEEIGEGDYRVMPRFELLIYNNSPIELELDPKISGEMKGYTGIRLINNHLSQATGEPYQTLGAIYRDAFWEVSGETDVIIHWDDDDLFLPNHLMEGLKGLERARSHGKIAYKPAKSYYRHPGGVELMANTLEPSIFVPEEHILKHGYSDTTSDQHLQWVNPLVYESRIFVDDNGPATLIYNWGDVHIPTFKTSGDPNNPSNFDNYRNHSKDHGDRVITPWTREQLQPYYDLVNYDK